MHRPIQLYFINFRCSFLDFHWNKVGRHFVFLFGPSQYNLNLITVIFLSLAQIVKHQLKCNIVHGSTLENWFILNWWFSYAISMIKEIQRKAILFRIFTSGCCMLFQWVTRVLFIAHLFMTSPFCFVYLVLYIEIMLKRMINKKSVFYIM